MISRLRTGKWPTFFLQRRVPVFAVLAWCPGEAAGWIVGAVPALWLTLGPRRFLRSRRLRRDADRRLRRVEGGQLQRIAVVVFGRCRALLMMLLLESILVVVDMLLVMKMHGVVAVGMLLLLLLEV